MDKVLFAACSVILVVLLLDFISIFLRACNGFDRGTKCKDYIGWSPKTKLKLNAEKCVAVAA